MKPRLINVKGTVMAFATPIQLMRYENHGEFNSELTARILAERARSQGRQLSNVGGWQSDGQILRVLGEPGGKLGQMFFENVMAAVESQVEILQPVNKQFGIDAWANVNERGNGNAPHIHPGSPWSGVYYVATEMNVGGQIVFTDPRTEALMSEHPLNPFNATNAITIAPQPGMMIVFPSFIYHSVLEYQGNSPRISIAFNLM